MGRRRRPRPRPGGRRPPRGPDAAGGVPQRAPGLSRPPPRPRCWRQPRRTRPFAGRVFEVPASVCGLIADDGQQTVLLSVDGGRTLAAHLPASLRGASWINSGTRLRALVLVERTGNEQSLSNLRLLSAAPEEDVSEADRQEAARLAAAAGVPRAGLRPSRSLAYRRQGYSRTATDLGGGRPIAALSDAALRVYGPYRSAVARLNPRLSDGEVDTITTSILYFSERERIDPRLTMAMIIAEFGLRPVLDLPDRRDGPGPVDAGDGARAGRDRRLDPVQNIAGAVHLLRGHLDTYGGAPADAGVIPFNQIALTMAAYNAGPGAVRKYHGVPPYRETRRYVARVASLYRQMCGM